MQKPDGWTLSHALTERFRQACGLMGACWFALNEKPPDGVQSMLDALNATTGWDVSLDELVDTGHRAIMASITEPGRRSARYHVRSRLGRGGRRGEGFRPFDRWTEVVDALIS